MLARNKDRISSRQSYDSESGSTSNALVPAGSCGSVNAGPRVLVRSGRSGKFPGWIFDQQLRGFGNVWPWQHTYRLYALVSQED